MEYNSRTLNYLKEMEAVLVDSSYKVQQVNFQTLKAFVNKISTYKKRNGKICHVEHKFGRWVDFPKEYVCYGNKTVKGETSDWCVGDRETYTSYVIVKFLTKESKEEIIKLYHKSRFNGVILI